MRYVIATLIFFQFFIGFNSNANEQILLMVSIDGFRHDYIDRFDAKNLKQIGKNGVRAKSLIPSYPTKTFPNHYTLVTGLYPAHHGIIDNHFYDPDLKKTYSLGDPFTVRDGVWYGGDPVWVVAEKAGLITASYFWVGSEAPIQGVRPRYYFDYNSSHPNEKRVQQVVEWIKLPEKKRPRFITLYFSVVDNAGHEGGPSKVESAVKEVDHLIGQLRNGIQETRVPVNLIVVSDHGMTQLDSKKALDLSKAISLKNFEVTGGGSYTSLHSSNSAEIKKAYQILKKWSPHVHVYLRSEIPKRYHLDGTKRVGDIVLIADMPWYVLIRTPKNILKLLTQEGSHGWDNKEKDMHGIFLAEGPGIVSGKTIPSFENIHAYPFLLEMLGLKPPRKVDGRLDVLKPIIGNPPQK